MPGLQAHGIIPARYASTRFPGKPLAAILGRPMFWHVWSRAARCAALSSVTLATDDERVLTAARALHVPAVMTADNLPSGTDRVCAAALALKLPEDSIIINIQGDEPALNPDALGALVEAFADEKVRVGTLARAISAKDAASPDKVKIALAVNSDALYFSRSPIPFDRDARGADFLGHIGIYAFRLPALRLFTSLPPSRLETLEQLEQLRLLENNIPIRVVKTVWPGLEVNRPEDIPGVTALLLAEQQARQN